MDCGGSRVRSMLVRRRLEGAGLRSPIERPAGVGLRGFKSHPPQTSTRRLEKQAKYDYKHRSRDIEIVFM